MQLRRGGERFVGSGAADGEGCGCLGLVDRVGGIGAGNQVGAEQGGEGVAGAGDVDDLGRWCGVGGGGAVQAEDASAFGKGHADRSHAECVSYGVGEMLGGAVGGGESAEERTGLGFVGNQDVDVFPREALDDCWIAGKRSGVQGDVHALVAGCGDDAGGLARGLEGDEEGVSGSAGFHSGGEVACGDVEHVGDPPDHGVLSVGAGVDDADRCGGFGDGCHGGGVDTLGGEHTPDGLAHDVGSDASNGGDLGAETGECDGLVECLPARDSPHGVGT